jgi:hypothetical protein|tara:strand:+ start:212 stop:556 length:345 start_codon:yes stop_codon:yes gene_type:complete
MEYEQIPEIEKESSKETSNLVKFVVGAVLVSAAILPLSGCYETHTCRRAYSSQRRRTRIVIINSRPIYNPPRHFRVPSRRHFNNSPYGRRTNRQRTGPTRPHRRSERRGQGCRR